MLDVLFGEFLGNSTYSEVPPVSPELSVDVTSLPVSAGSLDVAVGPYIGHARSKFLPLPMATAVAVWGMPVLARAWAARAALAPPGKEVHLDRQVMTGDKNSGSSG